MAKDLIIVESPTKAKTLAKYLLDAKNSKILASYGHVRDLIPKNGSVDPENNFAMKYQLIGKNEKYTKNIQSEFEKCDNLYLATDPDREGEAISWHIYEILKETKSFNKKNIYRVAFNEITKSAVQAAMAAPRELSQELIDAQIARRALDYLVGFNLSPLLWKKIRRGLSAGRVQSPALRLIVERQREIDAFESKEYWTISGVFQAKEQFTAKLIQIKDQKLEQFSITNKGQSDEVTSELEELASKNSAEVIEIKKSQRKRNPAAPFTTSTLQQESARKLSFTTQRTMIVAQQLYEGIDIGKERMGLITYMRTDSVNIANEALASLRQYIKDTYPNALPDAPRQYKTKSKNAQEAHEAIRPTDFSLSPENIKNFLSPDQYRLYNLIWQRTVASQMSSAVLDQTAVTLELAPYRFKVTGSILKEPGFMQLYLESKDDDAEQDEKNKLLPDLKQGQLVKLLQVLPEQHFTEPPPKFTEASLVKKLEEYGIGRPSTYASIISTLKQREYVAIIRKRFEATDVGYIVNDFLKDYFTKYVDYSFTAELENDLDRISRGEQDFHPILEKFWSPFIEQINTTEETVKRSDVTSKAIDEKCPECGEQLLRKLGKNGMFIGCSGFPDCSYTRNENEDVEADDPDPSPCPKCTDGMLTVKRSKYGKFLGCSNYPNCKHIETISDKNEETGVSCPECSSGKFVKRKSRFGTFFYSCNNYPDCKNSLRFAPINESCPKCNYGVMMLKETKRYGIQKACPKKECGHVESITPES